jgi:exosortase/archaeosortase family protein
MSTVTDHERPAPEGLRRLASPGRAVAAAALVGWSGAILTFWSVAYRSAEARVASMVVGAFTSTRLYQTEWRVAHGGSGVWFVVTSVCTSSVLLLPVVVVGAWAITMPLLRVRSVLGGIAAGSAVVVALNTARLVIISMSWRVWGGGSLWVTHDLIGTVISLVSTLAGLGTLIVVTGLRDKRAPRRFDDEVLG